MPEEVPANPHEVTTDENQDSSWGVDYTELQKSYVEIPAEAILTKSQSTEGSAGILEYVLWISVALVVIAGIIVVIIRKRYR
ncbi:hypothetical protein L3i20_v220070 [Paenibacillus sp. L3-i20]|nr:hypothetical protein L3i20_v220070 [Paenibacillus sp. L3-i20]